MRRSQKTQLTRDMYIFEKTVSYFTQYVKKYAKSLQYESTNRLVIEYWAKESWALELTQKISISLAINLSKQQLASEFKLWIYDDAIFILFHRKLQSFWTDHQKTKAKF